MCLFTRLFFCEMELIFYVLCMMCNALEDVLG
jgi:hypothetical protein